jgi:hypothetical protein
MGVAHVGHGAVSLERMGDRVGRVEMEDCLLETMTGAIILKVNSGAG